MTLSVFGRSRNSITADIAARVTDNGASFDLIAFRAEAGLVVRELGTPENEGDAKRFAISCCEAAHPPIEQRRFGESPWIERNIHHPVAAPESDDSGECSEQPPGFVRTH